MSWQRLLSRGSVVTHKTSLQEMNSWRSMVERDLEDAAISELSSDRSFGIAYGAVLILAKMVVAASGYRVKGEGGHKFTFEALELAMGASVSARTAYFDSCRRKRNQLSYDNAGSVSLSDAEQLRNKAEDFRKQVQDWLSKHHPHLA